MKHILLFTAWVIVVLHTLVPHQHHDDLCPELDQIKHASSSGILDFLELVFHVDMGDGHLENFDNSEIVKLTLNAAVQPTPVGIVCEVYGLSVDLFTVNPSPNTRDYWQPPQHYRSVSTLRGPPLFS